MTTPRTDASLVSFRNSGIHTRIQEELNEAYAEIATLSAAAEAEIIFLESLVRLHRKGSQICRHLETIGLPERDPSLAGFRTALEETKKTIPPQRRAEQRVREFLIIYDIPHDKSRTGLQSLQEFVKDPKFAVEILKKGRYTKELVVDLANYLLQIPCRSETSKKRLESIRGKNQNNPLTEDDISFLIDIFESILKEVNPVEACFRENMTTYKKAVTAAKVAYDILERQFKQVKAIVPETEHAHANPQNAPKAPLLEFNPFTINLEKISGELKAANTAIDALFTASEASEMISLESLRWIHQQAFQIYGRLSKVDLPGCSLSLDLFKTALEETEQTFPDQEEAEALALDLTTDYNMRHENQPVVQSVREFADCLRSSVEMLENGEPTQGLVRNLTEDFLLQVPSIVKICKARLESILENNRNNAATQEDISLLNDIFNLILSVVMPLEARFHENTTTCKKAVTAADNVYNALVGQFRRAKRIAAETGACS